MRAVAALLTLGAVLAASPPASGQVDDGRRLFVDGCASCHGTDARGIPGRAPSLHGAGAAAADFYLRTGRMPLANPRDQPRRADPEYSQAEIEALVAYVGSFGGPPIPDVDPARGSLREGTELFAELCMGCHQVAGRGGIATEGIAPSLGESAAVDVGEAVEVGPYVMPHFPGLDQREVDSLARYVDETQELDDRGGWGIGNIGPIPEGMVAWLLAGAVLLLTVGLIGERARR